MITGFHVIVYAHDAGQARAFFGDKLGLPCVDAGGGWLIFALPPAEMGIHPGGGQFVRTHADRPLLGAVLYLMCKDLRAFVRSLEDKGVACTPLVEADWGTSTTIRLPSGGQIGLYQPKHPTAF